MAPGGGAGGDTRCPPGSGLRGAPANRSALGTQHGAGGSANGIANHGARCGANSAPTTVRNSSAWLLWPAINSAAPTRAVSGAGKPTRLH